MMVPKANGSVRRLPIRSQMLNDCGDGSDRSIRLKFFCW
jgi:hypothetical protein